MESETGAKIKICGKGTVKEGKDGQKDGEPLPGEDEPLHAYVTSTNPEAVKKAVDKIRNEIKEAIKALDSKEIHGQRLPVQSKDKDNKQAQASSQERKSPAPKRKLKEERPAAKRELKEERLAPKSELKEDDVTHHLVFAINRFLDRQAKKKSVDEEKAKKFEQARDLLKEAFDIPDDDSLKINQNLEGIFLKNCASRHEIPIPPAPEIETKEVSSKNNTKKPSKAVKKARDLLKEAFDIPNDDSLKISRNLELIFLHTDQSEITNPPAKRLEQARDLLKETFDLPDDDSMKISQNLELIFLQNCAVQREIPIPPAPEVEPNELVTLDEVGPDDVEDEKEDVEMTEEIADFLCNA